MRLAPALAVLALLGTACRGSVTDPFRPVSDPVPSGLPASFRTPSAAESRVDARARVTAAGDSVVVVATGAGTSCGLRLARAGVVDGVLVVTILHSLPAGGRNCLAYAPGPTRFKVVVRAIPFGRYAVAVRERLQKQAGGSEYEEREITRQAVTVR